MRIWDIQPKYLCRKHLLAEHRELHGLWNILTKHKAKGGYSRHLRLCVGWGRREHFLIGTRHLSRNLLGVAIITTLRLIKN